MGEHTNTSDRQPPQSPLPGIIGGLGRGKTAAELDQDSDVVPSTTKDRFVPPGWTPNP